MKKFSLLLLSILLFTSLACAVPVSLYEFFGRAVDREDDPGLEADEEDFAMEVVPDPTDSPADAASSDYEPTLAELYHQGLHSYRVEGTTNFTEGTVHGEAHATHFFNTEGVRYHYMESVDEAFYERISENFYELITDNGTRQLLRYSEEAFTWSSLNPEGGEMEFTFWLKD